MLFLCATELHFVHKLLTNRSVSWMTCSVITMKTFFWPSPTYTVPLLQISSTAPSLHVVHKYQFVLFKLPYAAIHHTWMHCSGTDIIVNNMTQSYFKLYRKLTSWHHMWAGLCSTSFSNSVWSLIVHFFRMKCDKSTTKLATRQWKYHDWLMTSTNEDHFVGTKKLGFFHVHTTFFFQLLSKKTFWTEEKFSPHMSRA